MTIKRFSVLMILPLMVATFGMLAKPHNAAAHGTTVKSSNMVYMYDNYYSPKSITVKPGTTITWKNSGKQTHTVTSDSGLFDSGNVGRNGTFSWTFQNSGTYTYHCKIHGKTGGVGMAGTIIVTSSGSQAQSQQGYNNEQNYNPYDNNNQQGYYPNSDNYGSQYNNNYPEDYYNYPYNNYNNDYYNNYNDYNGYSSGLPYYNNFPSAWYNNRGNYYDRYYQWSQGYGNQGYGNQDSQMGY